MGTPARPIFEADFVGNEEKLNGERCAYVDRPWRDPSEANDFVVCGLVILEKGLKKGRMLRVVEVFRFFSQAFSPEKLHASCVLKMQASF